MRNLPLILLLCTAVILDHALALRRIKRNDETIATNHTVIAKDFVKLQIDAPLASDPPKNETTDSLAETSPDDGKLGIASARAIANVNSSKSSGSGSGSGNVHAVDKPAEAKETKIHTSSIQKAKVAHSESLDSAKYKTHQFVPTHPNTSASVSSTSAALKTKLPASASAPAASVAQKPKPQISNLLKDKKQTVAQQQQQQPALGSSSSSCNLKKSADTTAMSFMLANHPPQQLGHFFVDSNAGDDDNKLLLTRAGGSGRQLQPFAGERSHFKRFGGNLQNKAHSIIDCNIRNYASNNYNRADNNVDNMSSNNNNNNNHKDNNVVVSNGDKSGNNDNKNNNGNINRNNGNGNNNMTNDNRSNVDNTNSNNNNLMNIFDAKVNHNLLQQQQQQQQQPPLALVPPAPHALGIDNKINQFNKQSQQLQQLLYPQVGGSQQLWRSSNNKFAPMENVLKFANMLLYKVGLDSSPFHAPGAQFMLNPNLSPNFNFNPNQNSNSIPTTTNANQISAISLAAGNPLDNADDFDTIDYFYNTLDTLPSIHPTGAMTTSTSFSRPLVYPPAYGVNEPSQPFNFFESALDLLLGDEDAEDELEMRCPLHHDKKGAVEGNASGVAEDGKNDLIQVCSCRLIKKKKNA